MAFRPWEYRTETGSVGYEVDLTGYSVAAVDGDIGHVDEAINELLGGSYLLVHTGPDFGRTVMLPAGVVERIDTAEKKIYLDREPRTRSRTRPSTTSAPTTPSIGAGSAATTPSRTTLQTPGYDPRAGPLTPVGQHLGESGIPDWLTPGVPLLAAPTN
jgi:hypothetical protein